MVHSKIILCLLQNGRRPTKFGDVGQSLRGRGSRSQSSSSEKELIHTHIRKMYTYEHIHVDINMIDRYISVYGAPTPSPSWKTIPKGAKDPEHIFGAPEEGQDRKSLQKLQ